MINGTAINNINLSWLHHMTEALKEAGIDYIFQTCDVRIGADQLPDKDDFVILSPLSRWGGTPDGLGLNVTLQIAVVAKQGPGEPLKAFTRIIDIQMIIEQALYGSERLLVDSMGDQEFAIPFLSFDEDGNPQEVLDDEGLKYTRGDWVDRTPDGQVLQSWTTEINASIY